MKKIFLISIIFFCLIFYACSNTTKNSIQKSNPIEIAFVCDIGDIQDNSYNKGIWDGIEKYAKEKNIEYAYYKAEEKTDKSSECAIESAIVNGAKIVVLGGPLFENSLTTVKDKHKDVKFIAVDCVPKSSESDKIGDNVESLLFSEEEAGYLAGYAIIKDGFKNIGFAGGLEIPAIRRFSLGFLQGMNDAAKDMKLNKKSIKVKHMYLGNFSDTEENESIIGSWYDGGTEVVFVPAGAASASIMRAAEKRAQYVIGVDIDQSFQSPTVITSAIKNLEYTVYNSLKNLYDGKFSSNKITICGIAQNAVSIELKNSRFKKFTKNDYQSIYKKIANDEIKIKDDTDVKKDIDLETEYLKVNYIK